MGGRQDDHDSSLVTQGRVVSKRRETRTSPGVIWISVAKRQFHRGFRNRTPASVLTPQSLAAPANPTPACMLAPVQAKCRRRRGNIEGCPLTKTPNKPLPNWFIGINPYKTAKIQRPLRNETAKIQRMNPEETAQMTTCSAGVSVSTKGFLL